MKDGFIDTVFGRLPEEWRISKINDITLEHKQGYFTKEPYVKDGIYLARVTDLKNPYVDFSEMPKLDINTKDYEDFKISKNDFLFARSGAIGRYGIFEDDTEPAIFGSYIIKFKFNREIVVNRFVGYFYESSICRQQLKSISQGNANININAENIKSLNLPLPPLPEQQKIAEILTTVDDKLENIESQIAEYSNLKKGLMQLLLTKGIGHTKFKDSEVGKIPEGWSVVKIDDCADINMGQSPESKFYNDEGTGYYLIQGNADIKNRQTRPRIWTSNLTKKCEIGDIIMTVRAPVGAIAKSLHNACIGRGVCSIKPKEINAEFLYQFFISYESKWTALEQGSTFTAVNGKDIRGISIPMPPPQEQQKIADILSSVDEKVESLQQKKEEFTNLKRGLMEKLLTGKIRVKL